MNYTSLLTNTNNIIDDKAVWPTIIVLVIIVLILAYIINRINDDK